MPTAVAGWVGGICPLLVCTCGWEGGGPAPNYIKNISMLWLSLLQCPDFACLLPLGSNPVERVKSRLGCLSVSLALGGMAKNSLSCLPSMEHKQPSLT